MTSKDIRNYIAGNANELMDKIGLLPAEVKQKVIERQDICSKCSFLDMEKQRCSVCKCSYPGLTYAPEKKCPKGYWTEILKK